MVSGPELAARFSLAASTVAITAEAAVPSGLRSVTSAAHARNTNWLVQQGAPTLNVSLSPQA